jgi:8-oxo-dGTP pyrophosphatase MutT (NUDIX family)
VADASLKPKKNSHCSYCGHPFVEDQPWPRQCLSCRQTSFLNPLPVSVVLLPVDEGLLVIRRGIEPHQGKLALPGGYINLGESWQEAGARELAEETGITIVPAQIREFRIRSAPDGTLLLFGLAPPLSAADLPPFVPTPETTEQLILTAPVELAFPLHTEVVKIFFAQRVPGETGV